MKKIIYDQIINNLNNIDDINYKKDYLVSVIEETDCDCNGYNDMLIDLYNKLSN